MSDRGASHPIPLPFAYSPLFAPFQTHEISLDGYKAPKGSIPMCQPPFVPGIPLISPSPYSIIADGRQMASMFRRTLTPPPPPFFGQVLTTKRFFFRERVVFPPFSEAHQGQIFPSFCTQSRSEGIQPPFFPFRAPMPPVFFSSDLTMVWY